MNMVVYRKAGRTGSKGGLCQQKDSILEGRAPSPNASNFPSSRQQLLKLPIL